MAIEAMVKTGFYLVKSAAPWGDYGHILVAGMANRSDDGVVELFRTGPFVPPISLPYGYVIVRDDLRLQLESSGLTSFAFREVRKQQIVDLDWTDWDLHGLGPKQYPEDGEPAAYIEGQPHSASCAAQMGPLWELDLEVADTVPLERQEEYRSWLSHVIVREDDWNDAPFFFGQWVSGTRELLVDEVGKAWLANHAEKWIEFEPVLTQPVALGHYYVLDRSGIVHREPTPEKMRSVLDTVKDPLKKHGLASVELMHTSNWCLSVSNTLSNGLWLQYVNHEECTTFGEMFGVSLDKVFQLWLLLSRGDLDLLDEEPWK